MLCFFMMAAFLMPAVSGLGAQASPPQSAPAPKASLSPNPAAPAQGVVPGPGKLKERMGVYVFMAWLWASLIVLIFILRAKVREADRLFEAGYFKEKPPNT